VQTGLFRSPTSDTLLSAGLHLISPDVTQLLFHLPQIFPMAPLNRLPSYSIHTLGS